MDVWLEEWVDYHAQRLRVLEQERTERRKAIARMLCARIWSGRPWSSTISFASGCAASASGRLRTGRSHRRDPERTQAPAWCWQRIT